MDAKDYDNQKLQSIREKRFTQEQLAEKLNVHVNTISRAETGKIASFKLLKNIATECGVSVTEFLRENCPQASAN